jgi:hypothetical protein
VTQTSVAPDVYQAPDVSLHLTPQVPLNLVPTVNGLTQRGDLRLRQVSYLLVAIYTGPAQNLIAQATPNAIDIRQTDFHSLAARQVHPCNTRHAYLQSETPDLNHNQVSSV